MTARCRSRLYRSAGIWRPSVALFVLAADLCVLYAVNLLGFPYDYDQGEGFEVHDTVLFSRLQLPYRDTEIYPFYASNYPPLFHIMAAPFARIFGPAYWYGRLLGFLRDRWWPRAAIAYAVYRDGGRQPASMAVYCQRLAFLSSNFVYHIGPLFRQHMMMVTFEVRGDRCVEPVPFPGGTSVALPLRMLLLICAGYTKQLAAISALAAIAWMFLRGPQARPMLDARLRLGRRRGIRGAQPGLGRPMVAAGHRRQRQ